MTRNRPDLRPWTIANEIFEHSSSAERDRWGVSYPACATTTDVGRPWCWPRPGKTPLTALVIWKRVRNSVAQATPKG